MKNHFPWRTFLTTRGKPLKTPTLVRLTMTLRPVFCSPWHWGWPVVFLILYSWCWVCSWLVLERNQPSSAPPFFTPSTTVVNRTVRCRGKALLGKDWSAWFGLSPAASQQPVMAQGLRLWRTKTRDSLEMSWVLTSSGYVLQLYYTILQLIVYICTIYTMYYVYVYVIYTYYKSMYIYIYLNNYICCWYDYLIWMIFHLNRKPLFPVDVGSTLSSLQWPCGPCNRAVNDTKKYYIND